MNDGAIWPRTNDDAREFGWSCEAAFGGHRKRELSSCRRWLPSEPAGWFCRVLRLHCSRHVVNRDAELRHLFGVQAEQHREIETAERARRSNTWHSLDLIFEIQLRVVAQIGGIITRIFGR